MAGADNGSPLLFKSVFLKCQSEERSDEESLSRLMQIQGCLVYSPCFFPNVKLYCNGFRDFSLSLEMTCLNSNKSN